MVETFIKYHLILSKNQYLSARPAVSHGLHLREISPDYQAFQILLQRVGGPYGWDRRKEYFDRRHVSTLKKYLKRLKRVFGYLKMLKTKRSAFVLPQESKTFPRTDQKRKIQVKNRL